MNNQKRILVISFILAFNFSLMLSIIYIFPSNMPWVDDWQWMENLQTNDISTFNWLFSLENIHTNLVPKLLLLFSKNFLNFNFEIFNYLSIFLIFFSVFLVSIKLNRENYNIYFILMIIFLMFTGKQMPSVSQMSNISWFICYSFIILFWFNFSVNKISIFTIFSIIFAPLTLGFGLLIPIYLLLVCLVCKFNNFVKINYFLISSFSIIISFILPRIFFNNDNITSINNIENILNISYIFKFIYTYFGLLGSIIFPWIDKFSSLSFVLGLIQFSLTLLIFSFVKKRTKINLFSFFSKTCLENPLLIMGLIFPLLVSFSRAELNTSLQPRYVSGVLIFQLGFLIYCYNNIYNFLYFKKFLSISALLIFIAFNIGLFSPYFGLHWQIIRSFKSSIVSNCFIDNKNDIEIDICIQNSYKILFYSGTWYDFNIFKKQLILFKENKEIFFSKP